MLFLCYQEQEKIIGYTSVSLSTKHSSATLVDPDNAPLTTVIHPNRPRDL